MRTSAFSRDRNSPWSQGDESGQPGTRCATNTAQTLPGIIFNSWTVPHLLLDAAPSVNKNIWLFQSSTSCLGEMLEQLQSSISKGFSYSCYTEYSVYICVWMVQGSDSSCFCSFVLINFVVSPAPRAIRQWQLESVGEQIQPHTNGEKGSNVHPLGEVWKLPAMGESPTLHSGWDKNHPKGEMIGARVGESLNKQHFCVN